MKTASKLSLLLILACLGCGPMVVTPDKKDDKQADIKVVKPTAADVFSALADAVHVKTISTTTDLAQVVLILGNNGDLSVEDVKKIDAAFPDYASKERTLDGGDESKLKGIK